MQEERLPRAEQLTIRHQFHQVALMREEWLQLGARAGPRGALRAIVSAPQTTSSRIKHFEMLQMQEHLGLLVLVLQDGVVKQQLWPCGRHQPGGPLRRVEPAQRAAAGAEPAGAAGGADDGDAQRDGALRGGLCWS